jgi:flagellar biogenesis protein FliO
MPDISQPIELSFVFGTIGFIFVVIGIGVYLVKKFAPKA